MKIGIIQTQEGPNLAAFYGENWVSVPKALEALGEKPINEMGAFIETRASLGANCSLLFLNQNCPSAQFAEFS